MAGYSSTKSPNPWIFQSTGFKPGPEASFLMRTSPAPGFGTSLELTANGEPAYLLE